MSRLHFLNVGEGDCTIIEQNSGRITMLDICNGNSDFNESYLLKESSQQEKLKGNFGMGLHPTNPIEYLSVLGAKNIFRFILSHPDMDHMDGLARLRKNFKVYNFWDSGVRRDKPNFEDVDKYDENDWDEYVSILSGQDETTRLIQVIEDAEFQFANKAPQNDIADGLYILAPSKKLAQQATSEEDINDGSYVIFYNSTAGKILLPGDAHDNTWDHLISAHKKSISNCKVLIAPHHGRKSNRKFDFLDYVQPTLTLFGYAPSKYLAYDAWTNKELFKITNNQAGNIVLEIEKTEISLFIQNQSFAKALGGNVQITNAQGYYFVLKF